MKKDKYKVSSLFQMYSFCHTICEYCIISLEKQLNNLIQREKLYIYIKLSIVFTNKSIPVNW